MFRQALAPVARSFSTSARSRADVAKMTLIGRLATEPAMKQTKNGKDFLIYKVATTDPAGPPSSSASSESSSAAATATPQERTTSWHTIFAYGPACERLLTIEKGSLVHVEASFQVEQVKNDSGDYSTNIYARHERMHVLRKPYKAGEAESD